MRSAVFVFVSVLWQCGLAVGGYSSSYSAMSSPYYGRYYELPSQRPYNTVYVPRPYPVYVQVPVERRVPVEKPIPVVVERRVPVPVEKLVPVAMKEYVRRPYPVPVPVQSSALGESNSQQNYYYYLQQQQQPFQAHDQSTYPPNYSPNKFQQQYYSPTTYQQQPYPTYQQQQQYQQPYHPSYYQQQYPSYPYNQDSNLQQTTPDVPQQPSPFTSHLHYLTPQTTNADVEELDEDDESSGLDDYEEDRPDIERQIAQHKTNTADEEQQNPEEESSSTQQPPEELETTTTTENTRQTTQQT